VTHLRRSYLRYNRLWFSNRLPEDMVVRWSRRMPHNLYGVYNEEAYGEGIFINAIWRGFYEIAQLTLLHEMAHVATESEKKHHGPRWKREMRRLARIGAFDNLW